MLVRAPYTLPFFLAICSWAYNDAIPLATYSSVASRMQDTNKDLEDNWNIPVHSRARRQAIQDFDSDSDETIKNLNGLQKNTIINSNKNVNVNIVGRLKKPRQHKPPRTTTTEVPSPLSEINSANCTSDKKENQTYTSSFDQEFDEVIGNNSNAKKTCSVHDGEHMTLCWIETTTIKENKTVRPPKRLVIREYTISFENSATIPDRYLDCKRMEGELTANDSDIGKTTLFEVIDKDTKVSRVVNFTLISHVGDIIIWQHKKVKCGVGPVVTKKIIEWNDGTKNAKKRVEIKVSPKLQQLTATKPDPCGNTGGSTTTVTDGVSTEYAVSTTEKIVTDINVMSSSTSSFEETKSTTETSNTTSGEVDCEEDSSDPACITQELTTSITTEATIKSEASTFLISMKVPEVSTLIDTTTEGTTAEEEEYVSETILDLTTKEAILPTSTTDITIESSETFASQPNSKITTSKNEETTSATKVTEESTLEEVSSSSVESTSEKSSSGESTISSSEINTERTTTATASFTEYTEGPEIPSEIWNIISESSVSIESTNATSEGSEEIITTTHETSPEVKTTTLSPTTNGETDSCENSEDCNSESCESENCGNTTTKPCESEECSEEGTTKDQFDTSTSLAITTQTQRTVTTGTTTIPQENETITTIDIHTTTENRRSTMRPQHKLNLKIKVLLEHVNENQEKHNLVEVEKHLALNENPYQTHSDLIEQLKSLNHTVNMEAMNALLNHTSLDTLMKLANLINTTSNDLEKPESSKASSEGSISAEQTTSGEIDDKYESSQYSEYEQEQEAVPQRRRRRSLKEVFDGKTGDLNKLEAVGQNLLDLAGLKYQNNLGENVRSSEISSIKKNTDELKMEAALQTLPGIQEDVSNGLQHMAARLMRKNLINDIEKMASADLLGVIADPKDNRIRSRRRRAAVERVGHWSNERISEAPMGGNFRSFTEFILYKILS